MTQGPIFVAVDSPRLTEMRNEAYANSSSSDETIPQVNSVTDIAETVPPVDRGRQSSIQAYITVAILCVVNLLNYMDRFTIAGVLTDVKSFYNIQNSEAGLLQTSFICSYMILAPVFGYLGDRYNRKAIIAFGISFWSFTTLAGSFIPHNYFGLFMLCRGLVGVGEASYSTIAPTIIADLCTAESRSKLLALFYFAIPVGSGMGYMVGSNVAKAFGSWEWSLRITPILGFICVFLVMTVVKIPPRGGSEGGQNIVVTEWKEDILSIIKIRSFMMSTVGFTCVAFVAGALSWWGPSFLLSAVNVQGGHSTMEEVSLIFGIITVIAGLVGVAFGSFLAMKLRRRYPRADPLVCALGVLASTPFLFFGSIVSQYNTAGAYFLIFLGETTLCMTWAVVTDIMLYVVIPTRRSTAAAFQILMSHTFGDAGSPYIIGTVADAIKAGKPETPLLEFTSMQYALFITCFVNVLGGLAFLVTSWYIIDDKIIAENIIQGGDVMVTQNLLTSKNGYHKVQLLPNAINDTPIDNDSLAKKVQLENQYDKSWV